MKRQIRWLATLCLVALLAAPAVQAAEPGLLAWDLTNWLRSLWTSLIGESSSTSDTTTTSPNPDTTTSSDGDGGPQVDPIGLQSEPNGGTQPEG